MARPLERVTLSAAKSDTGFHMLGGGFFFFFFTSPSSFPLRLSVVIFCISRIIASMSSITFLQLAALFVRGAQCSETFGSVL